QHPVDVTAIADADHDLLARIAPLRLGDKMRERDLRKQDGLVDVTAEDGRSRLDSERLERHAADGPRAGGGKHVPEARPLAHRAGDPHFALAGLPAAAHEPHRNLAERSRDVRPRGLPGTRAGYPLRRLVRLRSGEDDERSLVGEVADRP